MALLVRSVAILGPASEEMRLQRRNEKPLSDKIHKEMRYSFDKDILASPVGACFSHARRSNNVIRRN